VRYGLDADYGGHAVMLLELKDEAQTLSQIVQEAWDRL
jgi:hypothetical protein